MKPRKPAKPRKRKRFADAISYLRSEMRSIRKEARGPRRDGESKDEYARRFVSGTLNVRAMSEAIYALKCAGQKEQK